MLELAEIRAAAARIAGAVSRTPLLASRTLSQLTGAELRLKFENLQFTASFKERGALNKLLQLTAAERARGVIAMSAGNHAQGVAFHAQRLGIRAVIVMPRGTPNTKVDCDEIPEGDALFAEIPGEEDMVAASIFTHNPEHRWYYYPDMSDDEVLFIKFYDSDRSRAWRCLHTAFADTSRPDAIERHSMEYRGIAYFSKAAA